KRNVGRVGDGEPGNAVRSCRRAKKVKAGRGTKNQAGDQRRRNEQQSNRRNFQRLLHSECRLTFVMRRGGAGASSMQQERNPALASSTLVSRHNCHGSQWPSKPTFQPLVVCRIS